jgi:diguanylate cyclase (GGDEF)-like protein
VKQSTDLLSLAPANAMGIFAHARQAISDFIFPEGIELRNKAERAANMDALTGLANRRALDAAMVMAELDAETCVILFDANNFGQVNKLVSHEAGDVILVQVADAIKTAAEAFGMGQRVFRRGGDEFVVLAPMAVAEQIRTMAEAIFGTHEVHGLDIESGTVKHCLVSVSGTLGRTFSEADAILQRRKIAQKEEQSAHQRAAVLASIAELRSTASMMAGTEASARLVAVADLLGKAF